MTKKLSLALVAVGFLMILTPAFGYTVYQPGASPPSVPSEKAATNSAVAKLSGPSEEPVSTAMPSNSGIATGGQKDASPSSNKSIKALFTKYKWPVADFQAKAYLYVTTGFLNVEDNYDAMYEASKTIGYNTKYGLEEVKKDLEFYRLYALTPEAQAQLMVEINDHQSYTYHYMAMVKKGKIVGAFIAVQPQDSQVDFAIMDAHTKIYPLNVKKAAITKDMEKFFADR